MNLTHSFFTDSCWELDRDWLFLSWWLWSLRGALIARANHCDLDGVKAVEAVDLEVRWGRIEMLR